MAKAIYQGQGGPLNFHFFFETFTKNFVGLAYLFLLHCLLVYKNLLARVVEKILKLNFHISLQSFLPIILDF